MKKSDVKSFLEEKYLTYNQPNFIDQDPIQIPHRFTRKEDIEIIGFLTATIAWGQRKTIIKNAERIIDFLEGEPYRFISTAHSDDFLFEGFVHRTFNAVDLQFFLTAIQRIYQSHGGLEEAFSHGTNTFDRICNFHQLFFEVAPLQRSKKHLSNPAKNSAAKRLNMYLRWMVRHDKRGVDFGIWKSIPSRDLMLPLDVHTGNVSRKLGLIQRKQNDWKTVEEVMTNLRSFDPRDPVKYDFALFGLGAVEKF